MHWEKERGKEKLRTEEAIYTHRGLRPAGADSHLLSNWDGLKAREKLSIVMQIASITCTLPRSQFSFYSALYRREDVTASESIIIDEKFCIEPTIGRAWFDNRRGEVDVSRGPCS